MDGITLTPLKQILHPKGDIFHVMKKNDDGFCGFGEAYLTKINHNEIKGWTKHKEMTLNLVVFCGEVEFIIHNEDGTNTLTVNAGTGFTIIELSGTVTAIPTDGFARFLVVFTNVGTNLADVYKIV